MPSSGLVEITPSGSLLVNLPLEAAIGNWSTPSDIRPTVQLRDDALFVAETGAFSFNPTIELSGMDDLMPFRNILPSDVVGAMNQLAAYLKDFQTSGVLAVPIPFAGGATLGSVLGLDTSFIDNVISLLEAEPNLPAFRTAGQLGDLLPAVGMVDYLPGGTGQPGPGGGSPVLLYQFDLSSTLASLVTSVDLGALGAQTPLSGISTESLLSLLPQAGLEFTLGIDMRRPGSDVTITTATTLAELNAGRGVLIEPDGKADLEVRLRDGTVFDVNLDSLAETSTSRVSDLMAALQAAAQAVGAQEKFSIVLDDGRLVMRDLCVPGVSSAQFSVARVNGSLASLGLGLLGATRYGDDTMNGAPLHGMGFDRHVFLLDAELLGSFDMNLQDIDATAGFGLAGISVENGSGSLNAQLAASLLQPTTFWDLVSGLGDVQSLFDINADGSAALTLPVELTTALPGLLVPGDASIDVLWGNLFRENSFELDLDSLDVAFNNFGDLLSLRDLSTANIVALLIQGSEFIGNLSSHDVLGATIPLLNRSVGDLLSFAGEFADTLSRWTEQGYVALDVLEAALAEALRLDPADLSISLDLTGAHPALRLDLTLASTLPGGTQVPLNVDLSSLGIGGISRLLDVGSAGLLDVQGDVQFALSLGLDLSNPVAPMPFMYASSAMEAGLRAVAQDLQFNAALGALGIYVGSEAQPGLAVLSSDGTTSGGNATFTVAFDEPTARHYFDSALWSSLAIDVTGAATASLPIFFPTQTTPLDPLHPSLELAIGDLADPIGTFSVVSSPDFLSIIDNLDLTANLESLIGGWSGMLLLLEQAMAGEVLGVKLPLIGDKLIEASLFIRYLRENVVSAIEAAPERSAMVIQQKLFDALGPGGLGYLLDYDGNSLITLDDVALIASTEEVRFDMRLGSDLIEFALPLDLDLGIPYLGLEVDGTVNARVGFEMDLGFGVSRSDGVYFDVTAEDDMVVYFDVDVPVLEATGQLGFLQIDVSQLNRADLTDAQLSASGVDLADAVTRATTGAVNAFRGGFVVLLDDPSGDGKLTLAELAAASAFGSIVSARLTADASLHLDLMASLGGSASFPSIGSGLHLYWNFSDATDYVLGSPTIEFVDVQLNLGEFFTDLFGPIISTIDSVIDPVRPILDVLTAPIPVISDLAGDVSLIDLGRLFGYGQAADFVAALSAIGDLANMPSFGSGLFISLGGFSVDYDQSGSATITPDGDAAVYDLANALAGTGDSSAQNYFNAMQSLNAAPLLAQTGEKPPADSESRLDIPLLSNPMSAFHLLLGKTDVALITYDMPSLGLEFTYSQYFPIVGPLGARISGTIGASADFAFGYDTQGFFDYYQTGQVADVFNGFYISDRQNADGTGGDVSEVEIYGSLVAAAELNLGLVSGGVGGGIYASVDFNLNDPNNDGKVRAGELWSNLMLGPVWIFDIAGRVEAGLEAYVKVGVEPLAWEETFEIGRVTLLDFDIARPTPASKADETPILGSVDGSGKLLVHVGPNSGLRLHGDLSDGDDNVYLRRGNSADEVTVTAFGIQQRFQGVQSIEIYGGLGNDILTVDKSLTQAVLLDGGAGDDVLTAGNGPATLIGGTGNDRLYGGSGDDILDAGGGGNNYLDGGAGNDALIGGSGDDEMHGGLGNDLLDASLDGNNRLYGGPGDDRLVGGVGSDRLYGGDGNDVLDARLGGNNFLDGGEGNDILYGGSGSDTILGGGGNDLLDASLGGDNLLYGAHGNDVLIGGTGNDRLYGGPGSDLLDARLGGDNFLVAGAAIPGSEGYVGEVFSINYLYAGDGSDTIHGDLGVDVVEAGHGDNIIYIYTGDDRITSGSGNDWINAGNGHNIVTSGDGNDTIYTGTGNDVIESSGGSNTIYSGGGSDTIRTGTGNDFIDVRGPGGAVQDVANDIRTTGGDNTIYGNAGDDQIETGAGNDTIYAFDGNNLILAGDGNNRIFAGLGSDVIQTGQGADHIEVTGGDNLIHAGAGHDYVLTGEGNDEVYGEAGNDVLITTGGDNVLFGGSGNDTLQAAGGNDLLVGGSGDDVLYGGGGHNILWGGQMLLEPSRLDLGNSANFTLPWFWTEAEALSPTGFTPPMMTPKDEYGNPIGSLAGGVDDGNNRLYGGDGDDFLFGGGGHDTVEGGAGDDYLDGGAGNDILRSGSGHDILRGGLGDDLLQGGPGISQLYGDEGNDILYGDAGDLVGGVWVQTGQRLWGGDGDDYLYAYAPTTNLDIEKHLVGDELHGGAGNDWLYGNIRQELITGGSGNDYIHGDALRGANYAFNPRAEIDGAADRLYGDGGEDIIYGGGGDDIIFGGAGSDELHGQDGHNHIYGGSGIDIIVMGIDASYPNRSLGDVIDGHGGNRVLGDSPDDNATDILLIEGTQWDDVMLLSEPVFGTIQVAHRIGDGLWRTIDLAWRDGAGIPLVEQFLISGGMGNDVLGFVGGADSVDMSYLNGRSRDWVAVIDGGPGNDIMLGTNGRDSLDGGPGSDMLYGFGGDDRLWGDSGFGSASDVDVLLGGTGNDDILGGVGRNHLFAWSIDPYGALHFENGQRAENLSGAAVLTAFAPVMPNGVLDTDVWFSLQVGDGPAVVVALSAAATQGNLSRQELIEQLNAAIPGGLDVVAALDSSGRVTLMTSGPSLVIDTCTFGVWVDPATGLRYNHDGGGAYVLERTGLNRMLGQAGNDSLYGGTDLDFLYGNGGTDRLFNRRGELFESGPDVEAGDEWKAFARESDQVWYYSGTELDDVISVDFVTEPGLLGDHHLSTRLTNNNGFYTFDAQVRLDFQATDADGRLIWDPMDLVVRLESLSNMDPSQRGVAFREMALNNNLLPPEGDFHAIIIDALDGDDQIFVGPTVQKSVWVDAGVGDDHVEIVAGNAILVDRTETPSRNEVLGDPNDSSRAYAVPCQAALAMTPNFNALAGRSAYFTLEVNGGSGVELWLPAGVTDVASLVTALTTVLDDAGMSAYVNVVELGSSVVLRTAAMGDLASLRVGQTNAAAQLGLGLTDNMQGQTGLLAVDLRMENLTIDHPADVDWYVFRPAVDVSDASVSIESLAWTDELQMRAYRRLADGSLELMASTVAGGAAASPDATERLGQSLVEAYRLDTLEALGRVSGLTIHGAGDVDYFVFTVGVEGFPVEGSVTLRQFDGQANLLLAADATAIALADVEGDSATVHFEDLGDLPSGDYTLMIAHADDGIDSTPARYELQVGLGGTALLNLEGQAAGVLDGLSLAAGTEYLLQVISPKGIPTVYSLQIGIGHSEEQATFDAATRSSPVRRDVIIGGSDHDVLIGGPGEDWIFGGPGNDVLSGGLDRQLPDLLFGGAGEDTFLVLPDYLPVRMDSGETMVPTQSDTFFGGEGNDRVLFLGGDYDQLGRPVPDHVAITYNHRTLHRYELAAMVWDTANQQFMTVPSPNGDIYLLRYAFYQTRDVERMVIDTRAGDDEVRADAEYRLPLPDGSGWMDQEWGIASGHYQAGAYIGAMEIYGGDGNDRLYGGALDDRIYGGAGNDFTSGGPGNDILSDDSGDDIIAGDRVLGSDAYDAVTRNEQTGYNDSLVFAALLGEVTAGSVVGELALGVGDRGDWYIVPAPPASRSFGGSDRALLRPGDVGVEFYMVDPLTGQLVTDVAAQQVFDDASRYFGPNIYLYAAEVSDPTQELV